ncbi:MAG: flagellar biosynthesis protein FlhA [Candidatus Neomarinimicrobiota bacterium]|nr:MAG: flagellar biosynthesis protein FlhA [Candidatus Neomarinimicrobiota bacterium]
MPSDKKSRLTNSSNLVLVGGIITILTVMLLPLPTFLMDMLLVMNITGALLMLFVALYILKPLEFSVFPGLLLITTLFRLSLNVATTRLILGQGYAGEIIETFGSFVVQGNYVVGGVIFLILVIINFVVITKGSTRIAEVSARFTLDAMPGKQMAIDADLNAGLIDDQEARERRQLIAREADFYGAMDGAAKFVRGDAIAGLLITSINILGGLAIGVLQRGMPVADAASKYTILTIGDGLVAQIPALIISTAAAIIITRATSESELGSDITTQITRRPKVVFVTAGILALMGLVPGMPFIPFLLMAGVMAGGGYVVRNTLLLEASAQEEEVETLPEKEDKIEEYLHPDPFEVEIGYGLIPLVDTNQGGSLLGRISAIRKSLAIEMGLIVPPIRIRDNIQLKPNEYIFKIQGVEIARGEAMMNYYLVLNPGDDTEFEGIRTKEPTFGLPAMWVSEQERERAEIAGYTTIEPPAVIATHLMETLKANAYKLLNRQETQTMLNHLKETHAAVVEGLVPDMIPLGVVTTILKNLLKEQIPIRNLVLIMETIADQAPFTKDPEVLTEYVRQALAEIITDMLTDDSNTVTVATLDPRIEDQIAESVRNNGQANPSLGFSPEQVNKVFEHIAEKVNQMISENHKPVLLVSPQIRRYVRKFVEPVLPDLMVISYAELTASTNLKSVGIVSYPHAG